MGSLFKDIRYSIRTLLRHRAFTAIAIATLALGIGANIAIFSLVNAVLLKPLSFPQDDRLVMVWEDASKIGFTHNDVAVGEFNDWRAQQSVFEEMAAVAPNGFELTGDGDPDKLMGLGVTANLFPLLRVQPLMGRNFSEEEDKPGANHVAILSYRLWQSRYGGQRSIIGREILLNGEKYSVIGVMPSDFQFMESYIRVWTPAAFTPQELANHDNHYLNVVARMKPGVTLNQAQAEIKTITERIVHDNQRVLEGVSSTVVPLREQLSGEVRRPLILLLASVGLVLLIACANIGSLLMARAAARRPEIALRAALGARRTRIMRQLLTESLLLSVAGGILGLLIAVWSFAFLTQLIPGGMKLSTSLHLDLRALVYASAVSLLTGVVFGLAPALQISKVDLNQALKQGSKRAPGSSKLRGAFVVTQIALALVLLVGAGLLMQTVFRLRTQYSVMQPEKLLTVRTSLAQYRYGEAEKRVAFYDQVLERVKALPGVTAAGYTTSVPLQWKGGYNGFVIEGRPDEAGMQVNAIHRQVSAGFFQAMNIGLRAGRYFEESDNQNSMPVAIVNETFARQYWPNSDPLGKRFRLRWQNSPWVSVVGVVADVREMGMDQPVKAEMYFPYRQITTFFWFAPRDLIVRTTGNPANIAAAVQAAIHAVDPHQPVSNVATMDQLLIEETGARRFGMILLSTFAGLSLLLASLGIYGVLSYIVAQQTGEIGVRMALGAQRRNILVLVLNRGVRWTMLGVALGLAGSFALTRSMKSLLFEVSPTDPVTFLAGPVVLFVVALLACYLPARRATKVDPLVALRYE